MPTPPSQPREVVPTIRWVPSPVVGPSQIPSATVAGEDHPARNRFRRPGHDRTDTAPLDQ